MSRRGLWIALIVSLAVNLFVLGGLAGAALIGFPEREPPPQAGPPRLAALGEALTPAQREAWRSTIRQAAESTGPKIHEARTLRREAWKTVAHDPVDTQAALRALNASRTLELQARSEMDRAVVGFAATLPIEERRKLADALSQPRPHHHPPHAGGWSGGRAGPDGGRLPDR